MLLMLVETKVIETEKAFYLEKYVQPLLAELTCCTVVYKRNIKGA